MLLKSMKSIILFNFYELGEKSNYSPEGIIILLYASIIGYNTTITKSGAALFNKLSIDSIPSALFANKALFKTRSGELLNTYFVKDPQSYITNSNFLYSKLPAMTKAKYIKLLSLRAIGDDKNYIPLNYVDDIKKYTHNPLIEVKDNKIYFTTEQGDNI